MSTSNFFLSVLYVVVGASAEEGAGNNPFSRYPHRIISVYAHTDGRKASYNPYNGPKSCSHYLHNIIYINVSVSDYG